MTCVFNLSHCNSHNSKSPAGRGANMNKWNTPTLINKNIDFTAFISHSKLGNSPEKKLVVSWVCHTYAYTIPTDSENCLFKIVAVRTVWHPRGTEASVTWIDLLFPRLKWHFLTHLHSSQLDLRISSLTSLVYWRILNNIVYLQNEMKI